MSRSIQLENIEAMRHQAGIEDEELRAAITELRIGDHVRLTVLPDRAPAAPRTVVVRITSIRGPEFRGKMTDQRDSAELSRLQVAFTSAHIHSLAKAAPIHAP